MIEFERRGSSQLLPLEQKSPGPGPLLGLRRGGGKNDVQVEQPQAEELGYSFLVESNVNSSLRNIQGHGRNLDPLSYPIMMSACQSR